MGVVLPDWPGKTLYALWDWFGTQLGGGGRFIKCSKWAVYFVDNQ